MIKKQLIMLLVSLFIGMTAFAQKNELKAADKAVKKKNFAAALAAISQAESLISNADAKLKAKFYYLKGMALYGTGSNTENSTKAAAAFGSLLKLENSKKGKYSALASQTLNSIINSINDASYKHYQAAVASSDPSDYKKAAEGYYNLYQLVPTDTARFYSSAYLMYYAKEYQKSADQFQGLLDIGYTGIETIYKATSAVNGQETRFGSKKEMDNSVRLKISKNPVVEVKKSKKNEMIKYIAFNYLALGDNDKALAAIAKARETAPNDYDLIIKEANIYFQMGDKVTYAKKIEEALILEPNNSELHYNVGTLSMDIDAKKAEKHLKKAIELNPNYGEAYGNLGNLMLKKLDPVQKEMDANAMNFTKYDHIKATKMQPILKESLPYLEKGYELNPTEDGKKQLNNLYLNLGMEKRVE